MNFCIVRLGKSSVDEIKSINLLKGVQDPWKEISITCKQVPNEVNEGTLAFVWLGSDNNKGVPTFWEQGLRAMAMITAKEGGPSYNDDWKISMKVGLVFENAIRQHDLIKYAPTYFLNISQIPVIGLNTHSNQTIQLIRTEEKSQDISSLLNSLVSIDNTLYSQIVSAFPELSNFVYQIETDNANGALEELDKGEDGFQEPESIGNAAIIHPFDPTKIDIRPQPLTILSIVKRLESDPVRIDLDTEFQRKGNLWEIEKQSKLIESLLVRIPLPAFYFDGTFDKWLIVDGLQRVSALHNFIILRNFKLTGLEYLKNFENHGWGDLPPYLQTRIEETPITAYIINPGTPEEVKFNIFKRINTGGLVLTPQEIRHALNQGIPAQFVKKLAALPEFTQAMGGKVPTARMEDRDYVTRFIGFYLDKTNYQPDLDAFLNKGMAKLRILTEVQRQEILEDFRKAMLAAHQIFGVYAFRKKASSNDRRKPINKALFECISVTLAKFDTSQIQKLLLNKQKIDTKLIGLIANDENFFRSISSGTGDVLAVERRYSKIENLFNEVLND